MAKDPVPVVPAAHYFCGGVKTRVTGKTELACLYAIGEVASTGLHGANRLASNSLLEACAMSCYAANELKGELENSGRVRGLSSELGFVPTHWGKAALIGSDANALIAHNWDEARRLMANYVGIVRSEDRLNRAARRLALIQAEIEELAADFGPTRDLAELLNILQLSRAIVESGLSRKESRGLHYMLDYMAKDPGQARPTEVSLYALI